MTSDASAVNTKKQKNTHTEDEVLEVVPTAEPETQELHVMSARRRMIQAQRVIDGMPFSKDLSNSQYKSIPIDAMRAAVRRACIEAGLTHELIGIDYKREVRGSGTYFYEGSAVMRFVNADDPSDYIDHPTLGSAMDNGDKGIGKLITNLIKNAYKETFDIGERGKDDIDAYANEDIEAEADRIAANRARVQAKAGEDRFFGKPEDPLKDLRRQIGPLMVGASEVVLRYKAEHGEVPTWDEETLRACIAEAKGGEQ